MSVRSRYGLVLLAIIGYYGHFFVPLLSLSIAPPASDVGLVPGTEFLRGFALFDYHYLTIGIVPFVFSGIIVQVLRWQIPKLFDRFSGKNGDGTGLQRFLIYAFASVIASVIVSKIPESRFHVGAWLTIAEMLASVWFIEQLVSFVKRLEVLSSPVMLFLGLNVASSIVYSVYSLDLQSFTPKVFSLFMVSLIIGFSLLIIIIWSLHWSTKMKMGRTIDATGKMSILPVKFKVLRVGITPVIYTSFIMFPLMALLQPGNPFLTLISSPHWFMLMFSMMCYLSYKLTLLNVPVDELQRSARSTGLVLIDGEKVFTDISDKLKLVAKNHSLISATWFMCLISIQSLWLSYSPHELSGLGFVGGISLVLIVGVVHDLLLSYKKLRIKGE